MELLDTEQYQGRLRRLAKRQDMWRVFEGKRFFVTGATGMIGTFLIDLLMYKNKEGAQIRIIASGRDAARAAVRFRRYIEDPLFTFHEHDSNKPFDEMIDADFFIHAASSTHPLQYANDPIGTITANIIGTKNVLDLALKKQGCRIVFLSSVEVYGENRGDIEAFDEAYMGYLDCNTLRAGYPESKRAGEALCQAYIKAHGVDVIIPRFSRVYGPTMLATDSKAAAQFIGNAAAGKSVVLKSAGSQYYSYLYVGDAANAILYLLLHGKCGEAYNVAGYESDITLKEFACLAAQSAGVPMIYGTPSDEEKAGYSKATKAILNTSKIEALGWSGNISVHEGILETVQILKQLKGANRWDRRSIS